MFGLFITGAVGLLAILPLIRALGWPPITNFCILGADLALVAYALTLLPTKLILSEEGLCQKQLLSELKLQWSDIAEWRYTRVQDVESFWIQDRKGNNHELKHWLVFGEQRSKQVAEVLRQNGVTGREEYDE
jgi:hypothetical protein